MSFESLAEWGEIYWWNLDIWWWYWGYEPHACFKGWSFGSKSFSWPHGSSCLILRLIPKTHIKVILGGENRRSAKVLLGFSTLRLFCIQHQTSNIKLHETSCQVCWSPCSAFASLLGLNWSYIRELSCQWPLVQICFQWFGTWSTLRMQKCPCWKKSKWTAGWHNSEHEPNDLPHEFRCIDAGRPVSCITLVMWVASRETATG